MKVKKYNLNNKKVQFLISSDEKLGKLIKYIRSCSIPIEDDDFKCIVKYIIGQQISDKTRESIWKKLCEKYQDISPETLNIISDDELRSFGICKQKITYIKMDADKARVVVEKHLMGGTPVAEYMLESEYR